ncbi:PREDICTED: BON1-associated protein 2-like [Ipomoea nil]|uniref:BON1-associated protein 2-like n=1 Tax=Ipomoea nil TaxID=35883 RepID=UPI000901ED88|nr:PREDICTED: BON1-associated protein 2-like [Ipomoea nil]
METSSRDLEITVISGEGLRVGKKNVFVTVKSEFSCNVKATGVDKGGGSFPAWNEKLVVDLPMHARYLTLQVQCKTFSGVKVVGEAKVPAKDFVGGFVPESYVRFLSYRLKDRKGEKNGIINISVRVKNSAAENAAVASCSSQYSRRPWTGLPPPTGNPTNAAVVTGIPVWCSYQV